MQTALITGATGFIGARLAKKLLKKGWRVIAIGRGNDDHSYSNRVKDAIEKITGKPVWNSLFHNLYCFQADLCDSTLNLTGPIPIEILSSGITIFHVAGDTKFNPRDPTSLRQINISGPQNVIRNFSSSLDLFVHVSTAYVAGDRTGIVLESEADMGQSFSNHYEKSKLDAEIAVSKLCREMELPFCITRPSIIINDSRTGRSSTLTHLNALIEVITRIQLHFRDGHHKFNTNLRIPVSPDARPNLAQVDPIVDSLIDIGISGKANGRTFHLCHPAPQSNIEIVPLMLKALGFERIINLSFVDSVPEELSWTEEIMLRSLKPYLPYLTKACEFDLTNTRSVIPDYDSRFPKIKLGYMKKVINFQRHQHFSMTHW